LIRWDTLLVLDLSLDVVNGVRRFHVEGDGLSSQGFDKNLKNTQEIHGSRSNVRREVERKVKKTPSQGT